MIFSKLILLPFLAVSSVAAVGFEVKQTGNGAGIQVVSEETANKLHSDSHRRLAVKSKGGSLRKLQSTHKSSKKYGAEFVYKQASDVGGVLEVVNGEVLGVRTEIDDDLALCTDTICTGAMNAVLPGYTKKGVDFLEVHLHSGAGGSNNAEWEFVCPEPWQTPSIDVDDAGLAKQECCCNSGEIGLCEFVAEIIPVQGSSLIIDLSIQGQCGEGVRGSIRVRCERTDPKLTLFTTTTTHKSRK